MLCESSHGRTDIGDDDQLLSGMNTTLHLCLASLSHVAYRRSQELLANRDNLNTGLLCASSQVTKTFVLTFKCGLARTLLRTGVCCTSLDVVHGRSGGVWRVHSGTLVLVESLTMLRTVVGKSFWPSEAH